MPKRNGKQGKPRSLFQLLDHAAASVEEAALRVVDGAAQRLGEEFEKGAQQVADRIAGHRPSGPPKPPDETWDDAEVCQCEGNVYYSPEGICQECGLPAEVQN